MNAAASTLGRRGRHRAPPPPERHNLALLWAGQFVNTAGLMMLVPIMPFYIERMGQRDPGAVATWAGVAIAAPALALVIVTPLWGKLGDRIGRKWMMVRALIGLAASMAVMATATTPVALVAGRLLQGTLGGVVEAAAGFASTSGGEGKKGAALGKSFSATAAGSLVGPLAGGALIGAGGLSVLMLIIGGLAGVIAALCAAGLREPPPARPERRTDTPRPSLGPSPRRGVRGRHLPVALPLAVAAAAAYLGVYGLIPIFADYAKALVADEASAGMWVGVAQSITWGATLVGSPLWGRYNDRAGRPVQTFAVAALGCGIAITAQALPVGLAGVLVLRVLQGVCFAALAQSLFFHASQLASHDRAGGAVGSANSFLLAGQSIGPLLAGPLTSLLPATITIALLGGSCLLAGLLALNAASRDLGAATAPAPSHGPTGPGLVASRDDDVDRRCSTIEDDGEEGLATRPLPLAPSTRPVPSGAAAGGPRPSRPHSGSDPRRELVGSSPRH